MRCVAQKVQYAAFMRDPQVLTPEATAVAEAIGGRVRRWRADRSWTLDGLADRSGVSRRTLVGIESGQSNPSIALLLRLAATFGVGLAELVEDTARSAGRIHRAGEAPVLWEGDDGGRAILVGSTEPPNVVEHWDWIIRPGERHTSEAHSAGTREIILVHVGRLEVAIDGHLCQLDADDSLVMSGDRPHLYRCIGDSAVHFTMSVLQPGVGGGN